MPQQLFIKEVFKELGYELPMMILQVRSRMHQVRTLTGETAEAFWNSMRHAEPLSIGFNCALGADAMSFHTFKTVSSYVANTFVSAHPNAGLQMPFGGYDETPEEIPAFIKEFAESGLINITVAAVVLRRIISARLQMLLQALPSVKFLKLNLPCR